MSTATVADPVAAHVAELEQALRGPVKDRVDLVREVRDGLEDAVDAYCRGGLDRRAAARRAVHDFGTVSEVAPQFQNELAAGQARRTALLLAIALPALTLGWELLWRSGVSWGTPPNQAEHAVKALAGVQDLAGVGVATLALGLLVLISQRTRAPRPVAAAAAGAALLAILLCGGSAVAMCLLNTEHAWLLATTRPAAGAAYLVSAAVLVLMCRSTIRTLRTLRRHPDRSENHI